jgi:hypothetical protein
MRDSWQESERYVKYLRFAIVIKGGISRRTSEYAMAKYRDARKRTGASWGKVLAPWSEVVCRMKGSLKVLHIGSHATILSVLYNTCYPFPLGPTLKYPAFVSSLTVPMLCASSCTRTSAHQFEVPNQHSSHPYIIL